jgi:hypothetical protein
MKRCTLVAALALLVAFGVHADDVDGLGDDGAPSSMLMVPPMLQSLPGEENQGLPPLPSLQAEPVYRARDCLGAVVNGVCHGSIAPSVQMPPRCYGSLINGRCTGPQF